jgi:hypothetical protein
MILSDPNPILQLINSFLDFAVRVATDVRVLSILTLTLVVWWRVKSSQTVARLWNSFRRNHLKVPDTIAMTKQDFTSLLDLIQQTIGSKVPAPTIDDIALNFVDAIGKRNRNRTPKIIATRHEKLVYNDDHVSIYQLPETEFVIYFKDFDRTMYFDMTSSRQNDNISKVYIQLNERPIMVFDEAYI